MPVQLPLDLVFIVICLKQTWGETLHMASHVSSGIIFGGCLALGIQAGLWAVWEGQFIMAPKGSAYEKISEQVSPLSTDAELNEAFRVFPLSYGIGLIVQFVVIIFVVHAPFLHWNGKKAAMAYVAVSVLNHVANDTQDVLIQMTEGVFACAFTALLNAFVPSHAHLRLRARLDHEANLLQRLMSLIVDSSKVLKHEDSRGGGVATSSVSAAGTAATAAAAASVATDDDSRTSNSSNSNNNISLPADTEINDGIFHHNSTEDAIKLLIDEALSNRKHIKRLDWPCCVELVS